MGLRILTVMNSPRHHAGGMTISNQSLSMEMRRLGAVVDDVYSGNVPRLSPSRIANYLLFGVSAARVIMMMDRSRGPYDIIEISGGDGYAAPLLRRLRPGRGPMIVSRCHGLEHRYWQAFMGDVRRGYERVTARHRLNFGVIRLKQVELSVRFADMFCCLTQDDADYVVTSKWKAARNIFIIPGGVDETWFRDEIPSRPSGHKMLFSGAWVWAKGKRILVESFKQICRQHRDVTLTIIGPGISENDVMRDFDGDVRKYVRVVGEVTHRTIPELLAQHDVILVPSMFEGFGTMTVEAMATGSLVVASAVGAGKQYVRNEENGFSVAPGDLSGFVSACHKALELRENARRVMCESAVRAVRDLTWREQACKKLRLYERALDSNGYSI